MNHFEDLHTVDLPAEFARALLVGASSEAVVVESKASGGARGSGGPPDRRHERASRRDSVVLYRVGRAFVAEAVDGDGVTRHLGLAPAEGARYVERVERDDEWTLLEIAGAVAAGRREADGTKTDAGP